MVELSNWPALTVALLATVFCIYMSFNFMSDRETELYNASVRDTGPNSDMRSGAFFLVIIIPVLLYLLCSPSFKFDEHSLDWISGEQASGQQLGR